MIATPLILIGAFLIYRERKPSFEVEPNVDWEGKVPTVKFGNNKEALSQPNGTIDAGITYSNRYSLEYSRKKDIMILELKNRRGKVIEQKTIDFKSKLIY